MYLFICPINNLVINENYPEKHLYIGDSIMSQIPEPMKLWLGLLTINQIKNRPNWFFKINYSDKDPRILAKNLNDYFNAVFDFCIWLVKDCCPSFSIGFLYDTRNQVALADIQQILYSKADGYYEVTSLTKKELDLAFEYNSFLKILNRNFINYNISKQGDVNPGILNNINYNDLNKFNRTIEFITYARKEFHLLKKISWYIVALESLFTIEHTYKISVKLKSRITTFFNNGLDINLDFDVIISEGYTLRSIYLHGSFVEEKHKKLLNVELQKQISIGLDVLLRESFKKIYKNNNLIQILIDKEKFNNFFKES